MMNLKFFWKTLVETFTEWNNSSATKDAASLAYYAIFSIPGLLIIIIWIAGNFVGQEAIQGQISSQINSMMGTEAAKSVEDIIAGALIDKQNIVMKTVAFYLLYLAQLPYFSNFKKL